MLLTTSVAVWLGASGALALNNIHNRAAKYARKPFNHIARPTPNLSKRQSSPYLTSDTES